MVYTNQDHTFAICAYGESPYLESCIESTLSQTQQGPVFLATATPNAKINKMAQKYNLPLFTNEQPPSIAGDWNFAYSKAETPLVTIAHQDDIYLPRYREEVLEQINKSKHPLLYFTDYAEERSGEQSEESVLLNTKRALLSPLKSRTLQSSRFVRRRILSLGTPICCPSVTMVRPNLPPVLFSTEFKCDLDWMAWANISKLPGDFVYNPSVLMHHRIHADSETSSLIEQNLRTEEDYRMFRMFWPKPIALALNSIYSKSQKSNHL